MQTDKKERREVVFFRNWYELAELQSDDKKRLAYYDSIFRYAFDGVIPARETRENKGVARAAYFAYLTVQPIIDRKDEKSEAARRAAAARWHNAPHNADAYAPKNAVHSAPHGADAHAEEMPIEKNRIEKNRSSSNTRADARARPQQNEFVEACRFAGVPEDFAAALFQELEEAGWADGDGKSIRNWRLYAKTVWNERKREGSATAADGMAHITEDDL